MTPIYSIIYNTCHFPHTSGASSSISEQGAIAYSKYIWPLIPYIFGLTVLITTNIRVSHSSIPTNRIGRHLHQAGAYTAYRTANL
jgi:hypothetical protein